MKPITWKTYFRATLLTSLPAAIVAYIYGYHAAWVYFFAFGLGMIFQADLTLWEFAKIIYYDFKRELKFWRCRLKRHKLKEIPSPLVANFFYEYLYCEKCKSLIKAKR